MQTGDYPRNRVRRAPYDPLKRSAVACTRCRGRKTKCTGIPPSPCVACEDAGQRCTYPESEKRVTVPESYLLELKARARAAETEKQRSPSDVSFITDEDEAENEDDDWRFNGMENLFVSRSGEHHYVGTSSSTYLANKLHPASESFAWDMHPMYRDPSWLRRPPTPVLPQLPPRDFARRLYFAQYAYIGSIFSFLEPQAFEARMGLVYDQPPDTSSRENCLAICQILLIFAYGQMYSVNQWSGNDGPPGFAYYKHALRFLPEIHEEGSILFVEVLGLVAPYMQNLNRRDAAFLYIGLALRMAISLGLHQEVSDPGIALVEREHRRRVWWSVYSMDRIICVKSGNPISIHDNDIDVAWPTPIEGLDIDLSTPRTLAHYTKLSRILGKIGEDIYRKKHKSGKGLLASVQSILSDLSDWLRNMPEELRLDFSSLETHLSRQAVSTFLHYYQCINMTARPLLFYVCQRRLDALANGTAMPSWKDGLSPNIVAVIDKSITSARASTLIMSTAAKQNRFATYGFMDGEHAFSAALILVMVNCALPRTEADAMAMRQALSVLQGMAEKGNEYLRARHALLINLLSVLGPYAQSHTFGQVASAFRMPEANNRLQQSAQAVPVSTNLFVEPIGEVPETTYELQGFQDTRFDFSMDDDPGLWDAISGCIDIDMDTGWIENALRKEAS